jgi:hypothetical protein
VSWGYLFGDDGDMTSAILIMANPHKVLDKSWLFLYNRMGYHKPGNDIGISLSTAGQDAIDF